MKDNLGLKLESIPLSDLGRAKRITVDKENTTIVSYNDNFAAVKVRIDQLSRQIDETTSDYDREKLQERRAGRRKRENQSDCAGFFAEDEEKKSKAMWFIVEISRRRTRRKRQVSRKICPERGDQLAGGAAIINGEAPLRQLTENAAVDGSIVIQAVRDGKGAFGYNVASGEYVDMLKAGIIDPTKVTRSALQNAASIAGLLLVTEAMVADIPKKDPPPPPAPGGMGDMY